MTKIDFTGAVKTSNADGVDTIASLLTLCLSDLYTLSALAQDAHWNVEGINFAELHEFFGERYEALIEQIDDVAERLRQLNLYVKVDLASFQMQSGIPLPLAPQTSQSWLNALYSGYQKTFNDLKNLEIAAGQNNLEVQNLAISINESNVKTMWMLRSLLKN